MLYFPLIYLPKPWLTEYMNDRKSLRYLATSSVTDGPGWTANDIAEHETILPADLQQILDHDVCDAYRQFTE